jgi:endonuclease/exonuclease/phosphatase family metal-dependent hydrolase
MPVVATYNVHSCVGRDGHHEPARVAAVIRELRADVVALQEVDAQHRAGLFTDQWQYLAEALGCLCIPGISLRTHRNVFGNALLTRHPVRAVRLHDISVAEREPRGVIDADLMVEGRLVRVIATHLGLKLRERRRQVGRLVEILKTHPGGPVPLVGTVLLGDLNEWRPIAGSLGRLTHWFHPAPAPASFPSRYPVLPLDRILAGGGVRPTTITTHRSRLARIASDHLPVRAVLSWASGPSSV